MSVSCQYRKRPTTLNYVLSVSCSFVAPPALGATTPSHVAYGRASRIILKGVSAARRTLEKPPLAARTDAVAGGLRRPFGDCVAKRILEFSDAGNSLPLKMMAESHWAQADHE